MGTDTHSLEIHPLARLFPPLASEELGALADDLKLHGQREPITIYQNKILDGANRYAAAKLAGLKELRIEHFDPKTSGCSPAQFVVSQNLRRRHLSPGQLAAVAIQWADELEKAGGLPPVLDQNGNKLGGRPRSVLTEAAQKLGISEQRVFELRRIRESDVQLYDAVRTGRITLNEARLKTTQAKEVHAKRGRAKRRKLSNAIEPMILRSPADTNSNIDAAGEQSYSKHELSPESKLADLVHRAITLKKGFQMDLGPCMIHVVLK